MSVPRDKTIEIADHPRKCGGCKMGRHNSAGYCDYCGASNRYPARHCRRRNIGGKRGRNSGTTGTAKNKGG